MAKNEVTVSINIENLDEAIEKANRLNELLDQAQVKISSLSEEVFEKLASGTLTVNDARAIFGLDPIKDPVADSKLIKAD